MKTLLTKNFVRYKRYPSPLDMLILYHTIVYEKVKHIFRWWYCCVVQHISEAPSCNPTMLIQACGFHYPRVDMIS